MSTWNPMLAYQNDRVAGSYDTARFTSLSGRLGDFKEKWALRRALAGVHDAKTALDAACGTGRMTEVLLKHDMQVTGVDISREMMQRAAKKLARFKGKLDFMRAELTALPFEDNQFDLVNCSRLFGHYASAQRVEMLCELARASREHVIIQYFYQTPLTQLKRHIKVNWQHTYAGVVHPVTEDILVDEITAAGLTEVKRCWSMRGYSEEVFILCRKVNG